MGKRVYGTGTYRQRGPNRWEGAMSLGFEAGKRRRLTVTGRTRAEVVRKLNAKIRAVERDGPPSTLTVDDFLTRWLQDVVCALKPRTQTYYRSVVRALPAALLAGPLTGLTPLQLQAHYAALTRRGLAANTVRQHHYVLAAALRWAEDADVLTRSPARRVRPPRYQPSRRVPLTAAQAQRLLHSEAGQPWEAYWWLLLTTGARPGELLRLQWADVDLAHAVVHIRQSKTAAGRRSVPLSPPAVAQLRALYQGMQGTVTGTMPAVVFPSPSGAAYPWLAPVRAAWYRALDRAGLPRVWLYSSRHAAATLLRDLGFPLDVVRDLLGHANIAITAAVYTHSNLELQREAVTKLGALLSDPLAVKLVGESEDSSTGAG